MQTLTSAKLTTIGFAGVFATLHTLSKGQLLLEPLYFYGLMVANLFACFYGVISSYGMGPQPRRLAQGLIALNLLFVAWHWIQFPFFFALIVLLLLWQAPSFFFAVNRNRRWNPSLWQDEALSQQDIWRLRFQYGVYDLTLWQAIFILYALIILGITEAVLMLLAFAWLLRNLYLLGLWRKLYREARARFWVFLLATWMPVGFALNGYLDVAVGFDLLFCGMLLRYLSEKHPAIAAVLRSLMAAPALYVLASFVLLSWLGAILLSLPFSQIGAHSVTALDSFFTAVSAVCVTGLVTVVPHENFSFFGQLVLIALIQIGGLGVMVFSSFLTILIGESFGIRREKLLSSVYHTQSIQDAKTLVLFIVRTSFLIEALGALILAHRFYLQEANWLMALWKGVFHAISAFCNAGFALQGDSLALFAEDPIALSCSSLLIVFGGLGFGVLSALLHRCRSRHMRFDLNSKVVLLMTLILLPVGAFLFAVTEWNGVLQGFDASTKIFHAIFYSASLRTAGFSAIDTQALQPATWMFSMLWMFIGGAPGGTAGGIKVTTVFVFLASLRSLQEQHAQVQAFNRQIVAADVLRSMVIVMISVICLIVLSLILLWSQSSDFVVILFEAVSAVATVGLSLGLTSELTALGKVVIIFGMFIGRVGPLTFLFALEIRRKRLIRFPKESLLVG